MVELQKSMSKDDQLFMFIPDLHSFTTPIDHSSLYQTTLQTAQTFLAAGLDANQDNAHIYRQSHIPAHSEMTWILTCFTFVGEINRMTEFKDKSKKLGDKEVSVGLMSYPILMAADILLYNADYVPLGDDQKQHMELVRTVANRFNNKFNDIFTVPKSWNEQQQKIGRPNGLKIRSLSNPEKKMSKSDLDEKGIISLADDPEQAAKKILQATTDSEGEINLNFDDQPGISNLLLIQSLIEGNDINQVAAKWQGQETYGDLKGHVATLVSDFIKDFQAKKSRLETSQVEELLVQQEKIVSEIAAKTLSKVQKQLGLRL